MDVAKVIIDEKGNFTLEGLDLRSNLAVHRLLDELAEVMGVEKTRKRLRNPIQQKTVHVR